MKMEKITIILTVSIFGFAITPLVSGLCDVDTVARCTRNFGNAFRDYSGQQDTITMMQIYCRSDVQSAIVCIEQESANCLDDTSYSSLKPLLRMVNAENLQENCNVLSKIPRDALNCLTKALDMSNTQFSQCITSASSDLLNSLTQTGFKALDLCSVVRSGQKCQDQAIERTCPAYRNDLSDYKQIANKFFSCPDQSSSAGKTSVTSILIAACFAILKL